MSTAARLAHEIPKPSNDALFEQGCAVLFKAELKDPNVIRYGRSGQNQHGIDLIGHRCGDPNHQVSVQCRMTATHDTKEKRLSDCRRAMEHFPNLREIIVATTAPDDTKAVDEAAEGARELGAAERGITIVVIGWGNLQALIAQHDAAYEFFVPLAKTVRELTEKHAKNAGISQHDAAYEFGLPASSLA